MRGTAKEMIEVLKRLPSNTDVTVIIESEPVVYSGDFRDIPWEPR